MVALIIRCPQCPDLEQGTSVPRDRLKEMLETGKEITVMGSECGHVWQLSDQEKQRIRKMLELS
jgi:uncharacterized Zn finger protein